MRIFTPLALTLAIGLFAVPAASAATVSSSNNWSGYVVSGKNFSDVSGSWVQPTANCSTGDGEAAFWVGLGGVSGQSQSLEQIGTQAVCSGGQASYYAWYEIVPAGQVKLGMAVHPGDKLSAKVSVSGSTFTLTLNDQTTGQQATKTVDVPNADTSSAEWIAEAPSVCDSSGNCQTLSLANFGSVGFSSASATAGGHTGGISDPAWTAAAVQLSGGAGFVSSGSPNTQPAAGGAQPSAVSADGGSFSVAWQSPTTSSTGSAGSGGSGGYSGDGGSSGYGGYGGYSGYGSGGYSGYGGYGGAYPYGDYGYGYWIPGY
jgi:hypothetical protein